MLRTGHIICSQHRNWAFAAAMRQQAEAYIIIEKLTEKEGDTTLLPISISLRIIFDNP